MAQPRPLFISYAREDDPFRRGLETHLNLLRQQGLVEIWSDRAIEAGQEWEKSIHDALEAAEIILLLISPDFLASEYIYDKELKRAMERHEAGQARVIPVFLRPCDWKGAPFGKLQGVPDNAKPISQWRDRDEAFNRVTQAVRKAALDRPMPEADSTGYLSRGLEALREGTLTPFIGKGVYGDGPLSARQLAQALASVGGCEGDMTLASIAECRESKERTRADFLGKLQKLIKEQQQQIKPPTIYRLLVRSPSVRLIISTTWDQLLEQELAQAGRSFAVVSHVLRSCESEHEGKMLVRRETGETQICAADDVDVQQDVSCVLYNLLGSPYDFDLSSHDELDTVVITESDHVLFLRRLANPPYSVPKAFIRELKKSRRPLVFFGYNLDLWQYRLVLQLFHAIGKLSRPLAVRAPISAVEKEAWRRLQADLIPMDVKEFAARAVAEVSKG